MKYLISFIIISLFLIHSLKSQDIIVKKNGEEIKAHIQEIGVDNIKYKKYSNKTGPSYVISKSNIFMIKYENGEKDVFKETQQADKKEGQLSQTSDNNRGNDNDANLMYQQLFKPSQQSYLARHSIGYSQYDALNAVAKKNVDMALKRRKQSHVFAAVGGGIWAVGMIVLLATPASSVDPNTYAVTDNSGGIIAGATIASVGGVAGFWGWLFSYLSAKKHINMANSSMIYNRKR